jgi:hypothetical protein
MGTSTSTLTSCTDINNGNQFRCQLVYLRNKPKEQVRTQVPINGDVEDDILDASMYIRKLLVSHIDKLLNTCTLVAHVGAIIMLPKNKTSKRNKNHSKWISLSDECIGFCL